MPEEIIDTSSNPEAGGSPEAPFDPQAPLLVEAGAEIADSKGNSAPNRTHKAWDALRAMLTGGSAEDRAVRGRKVLVTAAGVIAIAAVGAAIFYPSGIANPPQPAATVASSTLPEAKVNMGPPDLGYGNIEPAPVQAKQGIPPPLITEANLGSVPADGGDIGLPPAAEVPGNIGLDNAPSVVAENVNPSDPVGAVEKAMHEQGNGEHFVQANGTTEIAQGDGSIITPEQQTELNQQIVQDGTTPTSP